MEDPTNLRRIQDKHDPETRAFTHWAKLAKDGTVAAIVEVATSAPAPTDAEGNRYVEVTDLWPHDLLDAHVTPMDVERGSYLHLRALLRGHQDLKDETRGET
jgi:hypothetical protein